MSAATRDDALQGITYRAVLGDGSRMYITINEQRGVPFEVFVRYDDAALYEWIATLTVLITRLLRAGQRLEDIARELQEVHGPETGHIVPGSSDWAPSIAARIGRVLERHTTREQEAA